MRDDLPRIIMKAKEIGFPQVQIATNGIKLARGLEFVQTLKDAGLSTVYLHFDGVTKETNPNLAIDEKAIANCQKVGLGIVLVPTLIRGRNDHEVGAIIQFAADHIAVIRGVNFQPIAFTGAASEDDILRERIRYRMSLSWPKSRQEEWSEKMISIRFPAFFRFRTLLRLIRENPRYGLRHTSTAVQPRTCSSRKTASFP